MHKKSSTFIALVLVIAIISVTASGIVSIAEKSRISDIRPIIIIDAGHGGFDGGAVATDGTVEKDINLEIALRLEKILQFSGFNVIMTRSEDKATEDDEAADIAVRKRSDLKNRLALMNEHPDAVYISIHLNKFTTSAAMGTQVFYSANKEASKQLGQKIQSSVVKFIQPDNYRVIKIGNKNSYLLNKAQIPAVIVECGFLSNKNELALLKTNDYQTKMAFAIASGILEFYN